MGKINKEDKFRYVSLFSGVGGFDLPLNELGGECVLASEIDEHANKAYEVIFGKSTAGDVTKINEKDVPSHELLVGGFPCFSKGTMITTKTGVKPIEDIKTGDFVLTHKNRFRKVVVPMVKPKKGIYKLKVMGSPETLVTEEHPIYVREKYSESEEGKYKRKWTEPKWVDVKDLEVGKHYVGMSINNKEENKYNLTKEEAWIIGRYIAAGYIQDRKRRGGKNTHNNKVTFRVGKGKLGEFKDNVISYYVGVTRERSMFRCRIVNDRVADLCASAGVGSHNKRIPGFIQDLPKDILESFLKGYLAGDGSQKEGNYIVNIESKELAYGLGQVVHKLYHTPIQIQYVKKPRKTKILRRIVKQRSYYQLGFYKELKKDSQGVYIDGMMWMPVRELEYDSTFEGDVYNMEVEEDNSYAANNLTVSNCQAFSLAGERKGFEDARGTLFFDIARIAKEKQPNVIFLENVKGLVSHDDGRTLEIIINTLNEIGYRVDFEIISSMYFDVPQNRERIFIIAVREDLVDQRGWVIRGNTVIPDRKRMLYRNKILKTFNFNFPKQEKITTTLRDVLESDVPENLYLTGDRVKKLIEELEDRERRELEETQKLPRKSSMDDRVIGLEDVPKWIPTPDEINRTIRVGGKGFLTEKHNQDYIAEVVGEDIPLPKKKTKKRPKPLFGKRKKDQPKLENVGDVDMQGFESGRRVYNADGIAPTLTTKGGCFISDKVTLESKKQEAPQYMIRRLTPLECFRLQAFSDNMYYKLVEAGISNTQLYSMAGNAVTTTVIKAIAENIIEAGYMDQKEK